MRKNMHGKVVIVTGGATGIGRGCVERFASLGANVVISYGKSKNKANQLKNLVETKYGISGLCIQADVTDDQMIKAMINEVLRKFGRIDVLINNAGTTKFISNENLDEVSLGDRDLIMNTNVRGAFLVSRACADQLRESKGCIVNMASIAGLMGRGSSIPYAVSKAALINLTICLARVLAPEVRVNALAPGVVMTDWVAGCENHIKLQTEGTLLQRPAEVEDIVDMVEAFVCLGEFVTAQTLVVDGGYYI